MQYQLIYGIVTRAQLLEWLSELLGFHVFPWGAQLITKQPGEAHPWHTDIEASLHSGEFVSAWIGVENTSSKSALQIYRRPHLIGKSLQQVAYERDVERSDRTAARALAWDGGYEPPDPYDVMIVLIEGTVRTMGQTMTAPAFCYHPAGSLHGIRAIGDRPARYLVIEMHGERARADWSMADEFTATPGRSWTAPELDPPARVQAKWNHFADEDSRQINMLE